jgi:4-hydroxy-tetrahydrodipicolinate synthase
MTPFKPGLVHTPVTPFDRDHHIDYGTYAKVLEFHLRNGADALALPMPEGEDLSLTDAEQRELLAFAIRQVAGRVPVIAHVSDAGTDIAVARARDAESLGAAAIVSHPPYFWHPKPAMVVHHLVAIGSAVKLPFLICNPPVESAGTALTTDITLQLIEKLPNLAGVVDSGFDWVYMVEVISSGRKIRPDFQLMPGGEFMVSAGVVGGSGAFAPLAGIAPKRVRELYELCSREQYIEARAAQEEIGALDHAVRGAGESRLRDGLAGLKSVMRAMGRDCGQPRPPVRGLGEIESGRLTAAVRALDFLHAEPHGW